MAKIKSARFNLKEGIDQARFMYIMHDYSAAVAEEMYKAVPEVAKESVKKLKAASPKGPKGYAKGWAYKIERGRTRVGAVIYGKTGTYQLAHLLEYGHATRNGKDRVYPPTPSHEHIAPVNEWAQDELIEKILEGLEHLP